MFVLEIPVEVLFDRGTQFDEGCRCDELGIAETVMELDGTALRWATNDVVVLWPWEPPAMHQREEPAPPPHLPPDSWFARGR